MNIFTDVANWLAGNGAYMRLTHCMGHDYLWIGLTVTLDFAVACGYGLIAYHWWQNARHLPRIPARTALANMRNIFLFCGICGYIFIPVKMFWPAWRLYDAFMLALVYFTWKYAWGAKDLKVIYRELGRTTQLEADLAKSREESSRKSFFLNALSHDLRTPLNGLMLQANFAELNLAPGGDPAAAAEALREIRNCTRATADLLDSLLEYARVDWVDEANKPRSFELEGSLREVAARFRADAEAKGLYLKVGGGRGLRLHTDRVKFERILLNLLSNAVKFTDAGGVSVEVEPARPGTAAALVDGRGVEVHVIDSGIGIEPAQRERLFDEFYQVKNHERDPRKGFGLGLAIARRLARQLGGDILVESAAGGGSRFTLVLPAAVAVGTEPTDAAGHDDDDDGLEPDAIVNAGASGSGGGAAPAGAVGGG